MGTVCTELFIEKCPRKCQIKKFLALHGSHFVKGTDQLKPHNDYGFSI